MDRFPLCVPFTFSAEGGYSDDQTDRGNWMNGIVVGSKYGITWQDLRAAYGSNFQITASFMRNLTPVFAQKVMRIQYWNVVNAGSLWTGLDLMTFDFGFNAGNGTAVEGLQSLLGFSGDDVDGDVGPKTLSAVDAIDDRVTFLEKLRDAEIDHYRTLQLWARDGAGWTNRANDRFDLAVRMLADPTVSG